MKITIMPLFTTLRITGSLAGTSLDGRFSGASPSTSPPRRSAGTAASLSSAPVSVGDVQVQIEHVVGPIVTKLAMFISYL